MESPHSIIYKEEIREIPDRAAAALSNRGIARVREILSHIPCRWWPSEAEALAERSQMFERDSALESFDPEGVENAKPAPCSKRDILVFAKVNASPDAFFVVTKGPAAGKVFFFDHETGIDFDDPIADSLVGWIDALVDPEREWDWMDDEEG